MGRASEQRRRVKKSLGKSFDAADRSASQPHGLLLGLPRAFQDQLLADAKMVILEEGDVLFEHGQPGDGCYFVHQGVLKVTRQSASGEQRILAVLGPGAIVGEIAMIDGLPRSATIVALRLSRLSFVARAPFLEALKRTPGIHEYLVNTLAARLRNADEDAAATSFLKVSSRVARALLEIAQYLGEPDDDPKRLVVRHNMRQSDIAALAGVARESVSRTISDWRRRDMIEVPERNIYKIERSRLEAEARQE